MRTTFAKSIVLLILLFRSNAIGIEIAAVRSKSRARFISRDEKVKFLSRLIWVGI